MTDDLMPKGSVKQWFDREYALKEVTDLSFAFSAMADRFPKGSFEREMAMNAAKGVKARCNYLHDSLLRLIPGGGNKND